MPKPSVTSSLKETEQLPSSRLKQDKTGQDSLRLHSICSRRRPVVSNPIFRTNAPKNKTLCQAAGSSTCTFRQALSPHLFPSHTEYAIVRGPSGHRVVVSHFPRQVSSLRLSFACRAGPQVGVMIRHISNRGAVADCLRVLSCLRRPAAFRTSL